MTQAGGPGSPSRVSIRGSGSDEVLVLLDGVPLNSAISGDVDLSRISLESVERVTVLTGTQSARYGPRAMAGVIDIRTRRATPDLSLLTRVGAWGERDVSATAGAARSLDASGLTGAASVTGDYRTVRGDFPFELPALRGGGTALRVNSDVTSRELVGNASLDGDARVGRARWSWEELNRGMAGSIVQPSTTGRQGQRRQTIGTDGSWQRGMLTWTGATDLEHERETYIDPFPPVDAPFDDTVHATATTTSTTLTIDHQGLGASAGAELRTIDLASTMLAPGAPHWQRDIGAFGSARASPAGGASGTQIGIEMNGRADQSSLVSGTTFSPRVALDVTQGLVVLSASLGAGFSPPTLADQFFREGVEVRPNPGLQPERVRDDFEGRLTLRAVDVGPLELAGEAAAYRANVDGMILWLPDFQFVWSPSNVDVHRSGFDVSGHGAMGLFQAQASFSRSDVVYAGPVLSGQVVYRPRTTGNLSASVGRDVARLELTTRYAGDRRTVPGSALNSLDPYWRSDARITSAHRWRSYHVDASFGVENVLDQPAAMLVDYPFPSRTWSISLRLRRTT